MKRSILLLLPALLALAGCAYIGPSGTSGTRAPEPRQTIDVARFYSGLWHEVARRPMAITDGCVAGATEYSRDAAGVIQVVDTCRKGSTTGELKSIGGPGTILDPGRNAKLRVNYTLLGVVPIVWDYWVLERAEDYSWFISADPTFENLFIFARNPQISPAQIRRLVQRAKALGYDVSKLEFPELPKR